ncbi:MAG: pyridoxal-dependent decarboxylase, exosortase A system-associated, partial [Nitrosospira sp.]|nr:pyridoxal-dependent decarboxylase, exosortase A system-associated [Nitrosospira sp.]
MSNNRPKHAPVIQFPVRDNCLQIGGMSLMRLAQRVGRTPFYAYDRQRITERVASLRQHLPTEVHLHYAMKANP